MQKDARAEMQCHGEFSKRCLLNAEHGVSFFLQLQATKYWQAESCDALKEWNEA
jgi:hypothetical protein